jgi:hypothetical protein
MRQIELERLFASLLVEYQRLELEANHRVVLDKLTGMFYWPAPWIETMGSQEWQASLNVSAPEELSRCCPLQVNELAPMSTKLKRIARRLKLPIYEPQPKVEESKEPTRSLVVRHKRCPQCGDRLYPTPEGLTCGRCQK